MTWNILHFARMLKDAGGVPAYGNSAPDWDLRPRPPQPGVPPMSAAIHVPADAVLADGRRPRCRSRRAG